MMAKLSTIEIAQNVEPNIMKNYMTTSPELTKREKKKLINHQKWLKGL